MKKRYKLLALTTVIAWGLIGCGTGTSDRQETTQTTQEATTIHSEISSEAGDTNKVEEKEPEALADVVTFTDGLGYQVTVPKSTPAAVMSGSFAQCWLLAGGELNAVTEDVYSEREVVIAEGVANLGALKSPNMETLIGSGTEFAMLSANIEEHVALRDTMEKSGITTAYFDVETFEDYLNLLKIYTDITGREDLYKEYGLDIQEIINTQIARADGSQPRVLFLRAFSTGVKAKGSSKNMTGQMLKDLGCINIADDDKSLLDDLSMESIIAQDPDYIFVTTMGNSEEAAMKSVEELLTTNPAWKELSAVKDNRYHVLPKALFHNKPNNRWGESYTLLADILYGENKSE